MRPIILAGNWKMNKSNGEVTDFYKIFNKKMEDLKRPQGVITVICPSYVFIEKSLAEAGSGIMIGSQDVSIYDNGAYTGDVSSKMLSSMGVTYSIIGHSERREYFLENEEIIRKKFDNLRRENISAIFCIGEKESERENGETYKVLEKQLSGVLLGHKEYDSLKTIIAYEPVWAIGTGKTASPQIAQEAHNFIRNWLSTNISEKFSEETPILYGGSANPKNIEELLEQKDIDGGLIGGASLDPNSFYQMIEIAVKKYKG